MQWSNLNNITSKQYLCGFCHNKVATNKGYFVESGNQAQIYICSHCFQPTFFKDGKQIPGVSPGNPILHLPTQIEELYEEARRCISISSFTAAVLILRKLLMNISVNQGAEEGKSFLFYVNYLADAGYVPPNGKQWVDHIRKKGNEATHEIKLMSNEDALDLIVFTEMLLKFIYEFPNKIPNSDITQKL
ncbi:MAG: DUF4145 domain-containing protein [Melioribacteraceae bacterium]